MYSSDAERIGGISSLVLDAVLVLVHGTTSILHCEWSTISLQTSENILSNTHMNTVTLSILQSVRGRRGDHNNSQRSDEMHVVGDRNTCKYVYSTSGTEIPTRVLATQNNNTQFILKNLYAQNVHQRIYWSAMCNTWSAPVDNPESGKTA